MRRTFPIHGVLGFLLFLLSELFLFRKVEPFYSWFYCFAWWSYILTVDGVIFYIKGNSLITSRSKEFFLMIPWSIFIWLIFEAANLSLKNWYYINLPHSSVERWLGYAVACGTVLPGLFETAELLEAAGLFKTSTVRRRAVSSRGQVLLVILGVFCLATSVLFPPYCFPFIWIGFIFLLEPFNYRMGGTSLLKDLEEGNPRCLYRLLVAGLLCGLLWEFWNFWALSKWIYTVPFFDETKGFEMPFPGFLGFPPFAVQAYVMYNFISLFRFKRGWVETTYRLHPDQKTRRVTSVLTATLMISFFIFIFRAIDLETVDSYYPRLKDAYWIEPHYREELPRVGIASLDDLLRKTKERTELDELALRLLAPKEEVIPWIEKARLARLKGLGVDHLRLLESAGISSLPALALQDPNKLYERLTQAYPDRPIPSLAKIRIWIGAARKESSE
jgi:hypothetical protein